MLQDSSDQFDWTWTNGATPTQESGPLTGRDGDSNANPVVKEGYVYIETSAPRRQGDKAM